MTTRHIVCATGLLSVALLFGVVPVMEYGKGDVPDVRCAQLAGGLIIAVNGVMSDGPVAASVGSSVFVSRYSGSGSSFDHVKGNRELLRKLAGPMGAYGVHALWNQWFYAGASTTRGLRDQLLGTLSREFGWREAPTVNGASALFTSPRPEIAAQTDISDPRIRRYHASKIFASARGLGKIDRARARSASGYVDNALLGGFSDLAATGMNFVFSTAPDGLTMTYQPQQDTGATPEQTARHIDKVWLNVDALVTSAMATSLGWRNPLFTALS